VQVTEWQTGLVMHIALQRHIMRLRGIEH
jgi:hypothetical protein